jgi:DNA-binding MarR family transcriptional regulator
MPYTGRTAPEASDPGGMAQIHDSGPHMDDQDARAATIIDDLRTVYASIQRLIVPTWLKLDLSMAQFKALVAVQRTSGIGVCGLSSQLSIGESATSLLVDQLVRRGYVRRRTDPADRRRVLLTTTARGEERLRELRQGSREILEEWLATLDADELEGLARGLAALAERAGADETAATGDNATGTATSP